MEAHIRLDKEMQFRGSADSGHEIVMDASDRFGGRNAGPRPMELLLLALAGCAAMDVISILRKKRQPVEAYEVRVSAQRAEEHPRVFTEIRVEHIVTGSVELSDTTYCSVRRNLRPDTKITTSFRIERKT